MSNTFQIIPVGGLVGTAAFALYMLAQLDAQANVPPSDFRNAVLAEVQDAQGQIVLRGQFAVADEEEDDDVERKATLQPAGADGDAAGEAEVEFAKTAPRKQEVEFAARGLASGTSVRFLIDGQLIGQASVGRSGRADLEVDVAMPGAQ
jgi:hypothetical protein